MRSKKKGFKKVLAEFLCVALIACSIPGAAFAAEEENTGKGSVTSTYGANDGAAEGQKNVAGTEVKDTSDIGEQNTGEGDVKDPDGKTGIGGEASEGEEGSSGTSGTETKESDPEKTDPKEKGGDGEEAGDTAQNPAKEDDESDGESTEDSADKDDAKDDAGSEDNIDIDSDAEEDDTDDESNAEDDEKVDAEDEDESDVNDTAKGGSASSDDEEDEEDGDEEEEDWIDGPLDDDLMLLTATPSDAMPVAEMDGEYYDSVQAAIDEAENRATITMVDDSTENIIISDGLILTLDLAGFTLEGDSEGSVVTIIDAELTLEDSGGDEGRITGGSSDYGGGIYISDGTFRMAGGTISENTAYIYGGGVYLDSGTFTMTGGIICENTADTAGSDIYAEEGSVAILEASDMMDGDYKWYEDGEDSRYSEDDTARVCNDEDIVGASTPGNVRGLALVASDGIKPLLRGDDVWQIKSTGYIYSEFEQALKVAESGDTIILLEDIEDNIEIDSDANIILDLAGHTIDGNKAGSVITNNGTLTLEDSVGSGCITNGSADYGGGVYNTGTFNMKGGTISENTASNYGGGVVNYGTFNMTNGTISRNTANIGGGVKDYSEFNMTGGTISENTANIGGGVHAQNNFTMTDATISGNTSSSQGGGVYTVGYFTMNGGIISGNKASSQGGGIYSNSSTTLNKGTISENSAANGGGIYTTAMYLYDGGTVTGNEATNGGGIYASNTLYMYGGMVTGNTANNGAGIYAASDFNLCGESVITDNNDSNVYLKSGSYIILNGELEKGSSIGVTPSTEPTENSPVRITTVESGTEYYKESAQYFFYDADDTYKGAANEDGHYVELRKTYTASLTTDDGENYTYYDSVQAAVDAAGNTAGTVTMLADCTENVTIASGQDITLDLAGFTLDGNKAGSVITNNGTLTLKDSGGTGCITNGSARYGGGVYNSGIFTMKSGIISGNTAPSYGKGGGVYNIGTFEMSDGDISGNTADNGGGVYNGGTFIVVSGSISNNTAVYSGGGVYVDGDFSMKGGMISGNTAGYLGGGVYNISDEHVDPSGEIITVIRFHVSGSPVITDNNNSNVYLDESYIELTGELEEGASIGVTPSTRPTESSPVQITYAEDGTEYYKTSDQYFFYDRDNSFVGLANDEGHYVELGKPVYVASLTQNDTTKEYTSVQAAVNAAGSTAGTVTMLADSKEDVNIVSGQTIILDLDGYTLTGLGDASVILNYGTLTLEDSSGDDSGRITGGIGSNTNGVLGGGGINNQGDLTMNGGTITENNPQGGGGVGNWDTFTMNGGVICNNSVTQEGGGIYMGGGTFTMNGGVISGNSASNYGGGICNTSSITIYDGTIYNNDAKDGGGIYSRGLTYLYGGTITGNSATDSGGGVSFFGSIFDMQGGAIYDNTAGKSAADIYSWAPSFLAIIDAVTMLENEDPEQCYKWYKDENGNRYSPENITAVYDDENIINAQSPNVNESVVQIIVAGDEGHIYSKDNVTFTWDGTDSCTATFTCTDCGHEETVNCDVTSETVSEPTCTDAGSEKYTATATISSRGEELTVTDEQTEEIKALGHEWVVEQTVIEDSEDRYEEIVGIKCIRCGLEYEEEIVVSTESSGVTAHSSLSWSDLLTEDDLADLFESGAELDFKMTAAALAESDVPSADKTLAEDLIAAQWPDADYTASWLDISVLLDIIHSTGEEETREYSSTLNPVSIRVAIPDELLNADGDTYAVIRIHSGEAEVLDTTDNGDGTLTFESDLFSSYVIVKTAESDSGTGSGGSRRHSSNNSYTGSGVSGTGSIAYSTGTWTIDELGHWRYTDSSGRRYENEWGYIYNPYADTSAGQPSASWFHFGYDGIMDTGWFIDTDGKMYYLNPSLDNTQGAMFTGWVFIDGKWYYFDASGALLRSTQTPDGYTVDETGARTENGEQVAR